MKRNYTLAVALAAAILLSIIFHAKIPGINLLIGETLLFLWLIIAEGQRFEGGKSRLFAAGVMVSALFTVLTHSVFGYFMHFISLFLLAGALSHPGARSYASLLSISLFNAGLAQRGFFRQLTQLKFKGLNVGRFIFRMRLYFLPVLIIILFISLYRMSNPTYNRIFARIGEFMNENLLWLLTEIDFSVFWTFVLLLLLINIFLFREALKRIVSTDSDAPLLLSRRQLKSRASRPGGSLRQHYKSAVFLLIVLNLLLLLLNIVDVKWVWFNFEWEGQYLKSYVHNGTWLLICSILLSILILLVFFRGNLNFYPNNNLLRWLSIVWLAQNALLAISLGIRTYHYITYFNLAYKRIGVIIFLILTLYGLWTVYRKVSQKHTLFHLLSQNARTWYVLLLLASLFNWDVMIARYNFAHSKGSFIHLDYLAGLSDKALPWLDHPAAELDSISRMQQGQFPYARSFMDNAQYIRRIAWRKQSFIDDWESRNWLEWNYAEYRAYRILKERQEEETPGD